MNSIEYNVAELVSLVSQYEVVEALLLYFTEDFRAFENNDSPRIGLGKTIHRMKTEKDDLDTLYYLDAKEWMVKGNTSMIHWVCEFKDLTGKYWMVEEVAIAHWKDGKIYEEKYIYSGPIELSKPTTETFIYKSEVVRELNYSDNRNVLVH